MSNTKSPLADLFFDATREVVEKGRIKAQILRLERIMETDRNRLNAVYAQIGKLYLDGTLEKNKSKVNYALKEIAHLKTRLERAEERYEQLQEAHSVDECKEAFRTELTAKIKQAQDNTAITAYRAKKKAQDVISGKSSRVVAQSKGKSASISGSYKFKKAMNQSKAKKSPLSTPGENLDYLDLLAELEEDDTITPETAAVTEIEEIVAESAVEAVADNSESAESFDF